MQQLDDYRGWKIELDTNGRFYGTPPKGSGKHIARASLSALRAEIAKRTQGRIGFMDLPIPLRAPDSATTTYRSSWGMTVPQVMPTKVVIVSVEKDSTHSWRTNFRTESGALKALHAPTLWDDAVASRIQDFIERKDAAARAIDREYIEWLSSLGLKNYTADEIGTMLAEQATTEAAAVQEA